MNFAIDIKALTKGRKQTSLVNVILLLKRLQFKCYDTCPVHMTSSMSLSNKSLSIIIILIFILFHAH